MEGGFDYAAAAQAASTSSQHKQPAQAASTSSQHKQTTLCLLILLCGLCPVFAWASGLPDQGFDDGPPKVRTDYASPTAGTSANPLQVTSCIPGWNTAWEGPTCEPNPPVVYPQSNYYAQNWPSSCNVYLWCGQHWILILNNETAFKSLSDGPVGNSGPPDVSLPRSLPGSGTFGFLTEDAHPEQPGGNLWRAHLVLNMFYPNPTSNRLPYMAFGGWEGSGTTGPIDVLNPSNPSKLTTLEFGEKLWDFDPTEPWPDTPTQAGLAFAYLVVFADWGTHPKAFQLVLFNSSPWCQSGPNCWATNDWSWPITESVYFPGAQFVSIDAADLQAQCGMSVPSLQTIGTTVHYSIDLDALFHCADQHGMFDEPLPATSDIPITSVSWAVEGSGTNGGLWVDVHDMRMVAVGQAPLSSMARSDIPTRTTQRIQNRLDALCGDSPGCAARAQSYRQEAALSGHHSSPAQRAETRHALHAMFGWDFGIPNGRD